MGRPRKGDLTGRQAAFVKEYLIDMNGKQAAIRAGYSPDTAPEQASRLLNNANVADALAKAQAERSKRTGISAERVLAELAKVGFANLADIVQDDGSLRPMDTLARDDTAAINAITRKRTIRRDKDGAETETVETSVKLLDKVQALTKLAAHLGICTERGEFSGPGGGPIPLEVTIDYGDDSD